LQDNFTEGKDDMTNQVGIDMNNDADGDDLLQYNPNRLLDTLIENLRLKNDAALSRALEVAPPVISKIRHHRLPVGASLLIRMHEVGPEHSRPALLDGRPPQQVPHQRQAVQAERRRNPRRQQQQG
jgi:hypothetical protein